jgi:hypothetical protein
MTKQKLDVESILNTLASIRKQIPFMTDTPAPSGSTAMAPVVAFPTGGEETMEMFEMETLADALESFAGELTHSIETARKEALTQALEVYYAAEELAKDPEHADLIPYVQQMRESYRHDFGTDIPKR